MEKTAIYVLLAINYLVACAILYSLWKKPLSLAAKALWSLVLLLPVVGLVAYGFSFNSPPPLPNNKRQGVHEYIAPGGKEIMDYDHGVEK
ncbi:MAG: hypothetical protein JXR18_14555 [Neptuniibacter sp.]